jgi:hypothetical protein
MGSGGSTAAGPVGITILCSRLCRRVSCLEFDGRAYGGPAATERSYVMPRSTGRYLAVVALIVIIPSIARAGDCPIFVVRDWGVGKIDGRLMFYLGKGRYLDTPIPAPPEGPRWDMVYRRLPFAVAGACLFVVIRRHRRRA